MQALFVTPISDKRRCWDIESPQDRFHAPSPDIEPIGVDSIHALEASVSLDTIIFTRDRQSGNELPNPIEWQQNGILGMTITRYLGSNNKHVLVIKNLSRSKSRGYWDRRKEHAKDNDTEKWANEDTIERAIVGGRATGRRIGHIESTYRWRTAMAYGQRSIPTWLAESLSGQISTACMSLEVLGTQVLSAESKRLLGTWEAADHPWGKPAWWDMAVQNPLNN
jgi:hypothetical protein